MVDQHDIALTAFVLTVCLHWAIPVGDPHPHPLQPTSGSKQMQLILLLLNERNEILGFHNGGLKSDTE